MPNHEFPVPNPLNLAAPCGIYCGTCYHYLARSKNRLVERKLKHGCRGCREQAKNCSWVRRDCVRLRKGEVTFCIECPDYPCQNLQKLNERHVHDDGINLLENQARIREIGPHPWLAEQAVLWKCAHCGGDLSGFEGKCFDCGERV